VKCGRESVQLGARFVNARLCRRFMGVCFVDFIRAGLSFKSFKLW